MALLASCWLALWPLLVRSLNPVYRLLRMPPLTVSLSCVYCHQLPYHWLQMRDHRQPLMMVLSLDASPMLRNLPESQAHQRVPVWPPESVQPSMVAKCLPFRVASPYRPPLE
uniref:Putative secreted protein n=1 Tax=Anopheles darlingi TaxID=43151 RepID=A0A2M4DCN7_ANODA